MGKDLIPPKLTCHTDKLWAWYIRCGLEMSSA